jgi:hypothetical protein
MSALLIRREEVESWSDLAGLIPAGQQIYTAEEAHGNDETFAKRSFTIRSHLRNALSAKRSTGQTTKRLKTEFPIIISLFEFRSLDADPDPTFHFNADPDLSLKCGSESCSSSIRNSWSANPSRLLIGASIASVHGSILSF